MAPFVRRERKHKRLSRQAKNGIPTTHTNASEIVPSVATLEKEARRKVLAQQLSEQQRVSKISGKKRKRLDKYIDTKLRKEENAELVRKLADQKIDTSLLRSSKNLGRTKENRTEKFLRALSEKDVPGLQQRAEDVLFEPRTAILEDQQDGDSASSDESDAEVHVASNESLIKEPTLQMFGSGLKRPLDTDENGQPVIRKRKRRKNKHLSSHDDLKMHDKANDALNEAVSDEMEDDEEWTGFSEPERESSSDAEMSSQVSSDDGDRSEHSDSSVDFESNLQDQPARTSAFKAWADSQRNAAIGFTPSEAATDTITDAKIKANFKPRAVSPDPLLETVSSTKLSVPSKPAAPITISRPENIQTARLELPAVQEEQKIMEAINANPVTIICGATGSGKTTQVPQMLFENGYGSPIGSATAGLNNQGRGMIGITQPRRVAATSVADRVAYELGPKYRHHVAHQVRYDTTVKKETAIKFMTDGILLREIQSDFPLSKCSCIIIDEAHERSVNTDILIGMLSRIIPLRAELAAEQPEKFYPLKLVIMSATLRVDDFLNNERLFRGVKPPMVEVEGRQYTVTEHFARRTKRDYVEEMVEKVAKGHKKLPSGGMLVFLTGQAEILTVIKRLKERLGGAGSKGMWYDRNAKVMDDFEENVLDMGRDNDYLDGEEKVEDDDSDAEVMVDDEVEDDFAIQDDESCMSKTKGASKAHIIPLYAALPASQQHKVFESPPDGHRLIIVATNVAETSLTIPGIRYVFDSGRAKEKRYDQRTGIQTFEVDWISKASAAQRQGRAGRTGPGGHVWRLYSSAVYEQYFDEHTVPEILRTPLESVVLQLKGLEIEKVANFPFPTAPEAEQLSMAETLLKNLGAVADNKVTQSGKEIVKFPVGPRFGKMLLLAKVNKLVPHAVALVAALAVGDLYIAEAHTNHGQDLGSDEANEEDRSAKQHSAYTRAQATLSKWDDHSDAIKLLTAVAAHAHAQSLGIEQSRKLCKDLWLREKGMSEVQQLRRQLHSILSYQSADTISEFDLSLSLATDKEISILKQIVAGGFIDQVAIRADLLKDEHVSSARKPRRAIEVPYRTLIPTVLDTNINGTISAEDREMRKSVFVHPSSVLARLSVKEMPQYIVYSHLSRAPTATANGAQKKTRMHPLTAITARALAVLIEGSPLLEMGKPIGKIEQLPDRRRQCWVGVAIRASDNTGWPLGAWKVVQQKGARGDWVVEQVLSK